MTNHKILVPVDFSEVSEAAIATAGNIAKSTDFSITLIHILNGKARPDLEDKLKTMAESVQTAQGVKAEHITRKGNLFSEIVKESKGPSYDFMVVGTHGFKGLREKVFGADILKLLKSVPIPVFTVQRDFKINNTGFKSILFPASSHDKFMYNVKSTIDFARMFDAEIHLYTVEKPGLEWSDKLRENIREAKHTFEESGVKFKRVNESQAAFSVGYSKQILAYAKNEGIDLITMMANPTKEHFYFADSDKEQILTNEMGIPVLSTCDKEIV